MYCCNYDKGNGVAKNDEEKNAMLRVVPYMLSKQNEYFSMKYSSFCMEDYKAGSAR